MSENCQDYLYEITNHSTENKDLIDDSSSSTRCNWTKNDYQKTLRDFLLEVKPEYIKVVPSHWLVQEPPSVNAQLAFSIVLLLICVTGNISQLLVVISYSRRFSLRSASNKLLISLLLADFLLLLNCYLVIVQNLNGFPVFGVVGCQFYGFNASVAALAEIWSLAFVSFDRLSAIYYPLDRRKRITKSQANIIIVSIWATGILFSVFPLIGWNKYVSESYLMGCAFDSFSHSWSDRSYVLTLMVTCWLIPLLSIIVCYVAIIQRVRYSDFQATVARECRCIPTFNVNKRLEMEVKLAKMACTILLVWFLAWTPYTIISLWSMFFNANGMSPLTGSIPTVCTKTSAFANSLLYGIRLPKFKAEIKSMAIQFLPKSIVRMIPYLSKGSQHEYMNSSNNLETTKFINRINCQESFNNGLDRLSSHSSVSQAVTTRRHFRMKSEGQDHNQANKKILNRTSSYYRSIQCNEYTPLIKLRKPTSIWKSEVEKSTKNLDWPLILHLGDEGPQKRTSVQQSNNEEMTSNGLPTIATKTKIEGCQITATIHHPLNHSKTSISSGSSNHALKPIHFGICEIAFIDDQCDDNIPF